MIPRRHVEGVCFTSPYSMGRITGIGRFVQDLARNLQERGVQSVVISPLGSIDADSARSVAIDMRLPAFRNLELSIKTLTRLVSLRHRFDIIHAQQAHLQSLMASLVARALGKPSVLTLHLKVPVAQTRMLRWANDVIDRLALAYASAVVAVSPPVAESFRLKTPRIIENGVDTEVFRPSEADRRTIRGTLRIDGGMVFLFAGRWARSKGFDLLLRASGSSRLKGRPFHLVICGARASDEPDLLESSLPTESNRESIRIVGAVDDLSKYLSAGDVFVLPSRLEGMPLAFLEAMASGLPVIASDIPVHRRLAELAGCVWTFRAGDADDLARVMDQVIEDGIPEEWPQRARQTVLRHYNLDRMVRDYIDLYRELFVSRSTSP